ncbi:MAG: formylglycine-generating enzyme family protein, partial [Leptolyngbyaceae cyanobacterium bins.59]|nr:formylglycine-generating enzyme family protein [Leptolyngbyaceae cyanobacterium bins.59]
MRIIERRKTCQAQYYPEILGNGITLDMILIPGGTFLMGSPADEPERDSDEEQHSVTVPSFFMGKTQVTQAQWRVIATLPKVKRDLDPDPSNFKGENRENHPVEQVSWLDAVEFCDRLARQTHRPYRLPSEAEWEYACRAGTTTPFHFGKIITPNLANYDWSVAYQNSPTRSEDSKGTTPVASYPPNSFGLYDMHGNVWEWCGDDWHDSYENAPDDGSAWISESRTDESSRVRRGGSWILNPWYCRSAYRLLN